MRSSASLFSIHYAPPALLCISSAATDVSLSASLPKRLDSDDRQIRTSIRQDELFCATVGRVSERLPPVEACLADRVLRSWGAGLAKQIAYGNAFKQLGDGPISARAQFWDANQSGSDQTSGYHQSNVALASNGGLGNFQCNRRRELEGGPLGMGSLGGMAR